MNEISVANQEAKKGLGVTSESDRVSKHDQNEIIDRDVEEKIFAETKKQLKTDAFVAFAFKRCKDGLWLSRYIDGEFNEKYLISSIEEAIHFYRLVEKSRKESKDAVFEKVKKDIETREGGNDSIELFEMSPQDFGDAIICMGTDELQTHMLYAREIVEHLRSQLEELSYRVAEYEKHGSGSRP